MRQRRISYRRKGKSLIIEGRLPNGKSLGIWTLPEANKFVSQIIENASLLPKEKRVLIRQKYLRLAFKPEGTTKSSPKVPLIVINRNSENDANDLETAG